MPGGFYSTQTPVSDKFSSGGEKGRKKKKKKGKKKKKEKTRYKASYSDDNTLNDQ